MKTRLILAVLGFVGIVGVMPRAQAPAAGPSFEVASVKPNNSGDGRVMMQIQPGGRLNMTNVPLRLLIRNAYRLQDFQIVGPSSMASERYDIVAKAEGSPSQDETQAMMRSLLAERFKLATHMETRDTPIYNLVLARADGKLGAQLKPAAVDCAAERGRRGALPPGPPPTFAPGERPRCGMQIGPGRVMAGGMAMAQLIGNLSQFVNRVVIDKTGLTGSYDFDLNWAPELRPDGAAGPGGGADRPASDGPSIFTALQEQLGLKLDAARGPVEVLVIDHVEAPTPD